MRDHLIVIKISQLSLEIFCQCKAGPVSQAFHLPGPSALFSFPGSVSIGQEIMTLYPPAVDYHLLRPAPRSPHSPCTTPADQADMMRSMCEQSRSHSK